MTKNWSLRSAKALIIRELAAAEQTELQALRHLRNVGEEWIAIKEELGERGVNIADWCRDNMPISRQWLDRHAELFKSWKAFLAARKWAQEVGYASRRQSGLDYALELLAAKNRSEMLTKASAPAVIPAVRGPAATKLANSEGPIALNPTSTLYAGDCREVLRHIPDATVDVVIADPPYFLRQKEWSLVDDLLDANGMKPRLREEWDQFADIDEYLDFTRQWLEQAMRVLTDEGSVFVFSSYHCVGLINYVMQRRDINMVHHIAWIKRNAKPNLSTRRLQLSNETIIWAIKTDQYRFNYADVKTATYEGDYLAKPGMQLRDAWDIPTASHESTGHPTQKPVKVYQRILDVAGLPGGVVLDPFAGSGTAAVAARNCGMRSILVERDARYLDIIKQRVGKAGGKRRHAANDEDGAVGAVAD